MAAAYPPGRMMTYARYSLVPGRMLTYAPYSPGRRQLPRRRRTSASLQDTSSSPLRSTGQCLASHPISVLD